LARWLADNGRIDRSPFARLKPMNVRLDTRRRRGELTPTELGALLTATDSNGTVFGLRGSDRAMLYRVAVGTGFRAKELRALLPDCFDLAAIPPAVILPAEASKNRKGAVQPLSDDLAADLRTYLNGREGKQPVWPGRWHLKAADMLRGDLRAANVPVEVDGPEGVETRDFHALRACYISNVIRAGADLKQAMTLARHSDPRLTAGRYARTRLHDLGAVVNKLPGATEPSSETAALLPTGTGGGTAYVPAGCTYPR
jgi:integrase